MAFNPANIKIVEEGEKFVGRYDGGSQPLEITFHFSSAGRAHLRVNRGGELLEDIELRLPTTNALSSKMHATAMIMSAAERHHEKS